MSGVAFYAAIKPPDHPIASGDRLIAENLLKALNMAELDSFLASRFIAYSKRWSGEILNERKTDALAEADRLIDELRHDPPRLWMTYHPYCKAPDWIGPRVSAALGIPYVTVEAAKTGQGLADGQDLWADWRAEAQAGLKQADLHLAFKPTDRLYLESLLGPDASITDLTPFIDTSIDKNIDPIPRKTGWRADVPMIVTAGMMRPGKKVENYRILADTLAALQGLPWTLLVLGDGPERGAIEQFFADIDRDRLHFAGAVSHDEVLGHMAAADLFCWPGWQEPIGMVYLEAQLMGLPVIALRSMGVPLVVEHGKTGLLAQVTEDATHQPHFVDNLRLALSQPALRQDLAANARNHVLTKHSLEPAAANLHRALTPLLA